MEPIKNKLEIMKNRIYDILAENSNLQGLKYEIEHFKAKQKSLKELVAEIQKYKEENNKEQIDKLKKAIRENTIISRDIAQAINDLKNKIQTKVKERDLLLAKIQSVKSTNDVGFIKSYQKSSDNYCRLKADKEQLMKDLEDIKLRKEELRSELAAMIDYEKANDDLICLLSKHVCAKQNLIDKQIELKNLKKTNAEFSKLFDIYHKRLQETIAELHLKMTEWDKETSENLLYKKFYNLDVPSSSLKSQLDDSFCEFNSSDGELDSFLDL